MPREETPMITKPAGTLVLLLAALVAGSAGCKEAKPLDTDTDTDTDTDDGNDTDDPITDGFPEYFAVERALFGVDAATDEVIAVKELDAGGTPVDVPITLVLRLTTHEVLFEDAVEGEPDGGETCRITLTHPGPLPTATWTDAAGAWLGF